MNINKVTSRFFW